jgi:hypothetical protein
MTANWKTPFNYERTNDKLCPEFAWWVQPVPNNIHAAKCTWCSITFNLSNMGRQSLLSHMKSSQHMIWFGLGFFTALQHKKAISASSTVKLLYIMHK